MTVVATACFAMPILKDFGGGSDKKPSQKYQRFDDAQDEPTDTTETSFDIPPGLVGRTLEGGGVLSRHTSERGIGARVLSTIAEDPADDPHSPVRSISSPGSPTGPDWLKNKTPVENVVDEDSDLEVTERPAEKLPEAKNWIRDMLPNREYWQCIITFSLLQGVGSGTFLSNLGLMCESLGFTSDDRLNIVMFASVFNCLGRVASGFAMDYLYKFGVPKAAHFCFTGFGMLTTCVLLIFFPGVTMASPWTVSLFMAVIVGSYGANWAILPAVLALRYDPRHLGMNFCAGSASMSLVVWSLAWLTGKLYDLASILGGENADVDESDPSGADADAITKQVVSCMGYHCFRGAHIAGAVVAATGLYSAYRLLRRVKANDLSGAREYT